MLYKVVRAFESVNEIAVNLSFSENHMKTISAKQAKVHYAYFLQRD